MAIRLGVFAGLLGAALIAGSAANASVLYTNGPINGTIDAVTINNGFSVSDSFTLSAPGLADSAAVGIWNYPGDQIAQLDWSIGTTQFGSDVASGTVGVSDTFKFADGFGYDINSDSFVLGGIPLSAGTTYWLTLQNAVTTDANYTYWDQNNGPSDAWQSDGSSSYDLNGYFQAGSGSNSFAICDTRSCAIPDAAVPEPFTLSLFGAGLAGAVAMRRRRKKPVTA